MSKGIQARLTPKACEDGGEFSGSVVLRLPSFNERVALLEDANVSVDDKGAIDLSKTNLLTVMASISGKIKDNFVAIDITHKETEFKIQTYDELATFPGGEEILSELTTKFVTGFKLGNGLKLISGKT